MKIDLGRPTGPFIAEKDYAPKMSQSVKVNAQAFGYAYSPNLLYSPNVLYPFGKMGGEYPTIEKKDY